ncbi:hypothetical protein KDH_44210 [Dictyobacter sp. S3.2.2.5]|uniref:Uncharacterized protein n=1 Tax=Dictyobacter halimunensis TaxID=3026934 RepID=A0ABQ6FYX7_9CHLR|nr:hypothetical protein KDH_44210 [Dictyobacter sp. S3.2.2.5]
MQGAGIGGASSIQAAVRFILKIASFVLGSIATLQQYSGKMSPKQDIIVHRQSIV